MSRMEVGRFVRRFDAIAAAVAIVAAAFVLAVGAIAASASTSTLRGNASTVNAASDCSGATAWHFVLPAGGDSPRPTFVSITAVFKSAGTVTYSGPFTHNDTQTPDDGTGFVTPIADTLLSATAVASGSDADDFFVLSSIICSGASPSAISTTVFDAATNAAWAGIEVAPASAYDTSTVTGSATGTVSYIFFTNGTCNGDGTDAGTVAVGTHSITESALAAGSYSFQARYNGNATYAGSTSPCEPFSVTAPPTGPAETSITTVVFNAATNAALIGGNLVAGGSVYDTSAVTGGATGTVSYKFWTNGDCGVSENVAGTDAGTALALGSHSSPEGPLTARSYSFEAVYSSDNTALFTNATGSCELFSVTARPAGPAETSITTVVFNAATNAALIGGNLVAGGSVYDTSTVLAGATGTISYKFWANADCGVSEDIAGTDAGTALALGSHSSAEGPLTAGSYSFEAVYTSDNTSLFTNATGSCEHFTVAILPPGPESTTTRTAVFDAATNAALIDGNLTTGGSAYDTSTVTGATGTVSYLFWTNGDCGVSEDVAGTHAGTALALGAHSSAEGPLAAGSYSFEAVYSSDNTALFTGSTSACEPFTVVSGGVGGSTVGPSPTATPTGGVLAATGSNSPAQGLALFLIAFGLLAMVGGALAWKRRRS